MYDLDETIKARRAVRGFLPDRVVPRQLLVEVLELAQRAPSNCNVQPWRVFIASGQRCDRLRHLLTEAVVRGEGQDLAVQRFEGVYRERQVECAVELYGAMGVARHDRPARDRAMLRNFEFFGAPHVAIVCMEEQFGLPVALDIGAYIQTFILALWSRGIASCPQVALRGPADLIRQELAIPPNLQVLCGISFGYEDPAHPANQVRQARQALAQNVVFVD